MNYIIVIIFNLLYCSGLIASQPWEAHRKDELQEEYNKGQKCGQYGIFANEIRERLTQQTDLKEATRLATLLRSYIHGEIIAFDSNTALTNEDQKHILYAHATVSAFFNLSPLGTCRYREDTLLHTHKPLCSHYAQKLAIVADATQLALWKPNATAEEIRQHAFLQMISPYYQKAGTCDLSNVWGNTTPEAAREQVNALLNDEIIHQILSLSHSIIGSSQPIFKAQQEAMKRVWIITPKDYATPASQLLEEGEKFIWSIHDGQCGWYSVLPPWLRYKDANSVIPRDKYRQYISVLKEHDLCRQEWWFKLLCEDIETMGTWHLTWFDGSSGTPNNIFLPYACQTDTVTSCNTGLDIKSSTRDRIRIHKGPQIIHVCILQTLQEWQKKDPEKCNEFLDLKKIDKNKISIDRESIDNMDCYLDGIAFALYHDSFTDHFEEAAQSFLAQPTKTESPETFNPLEYYKSLPKQIFEPSPMRVSAYNRNQLFWDPLVKCGGLDSINFATRLRHPVRLYNGWDLTQVATQHTWGYPTNQTAYTAWLKEYGLIS